MSRNVLIVTDELYPFTAGGIGRIVHNLLVDSLAHRPDIQLHVLMPPYVKVQPQQVELFFRGRVRLHRAEYREHHVTAMDAQGVYPPPGAFTDTRWHAESLDVMLSLKRMEREGLHFDAIEFPDFRGLAFCTLQEKRLGLAFQQTEIAVRLHSSHGVLMHFEPSTLELENLGRFEIERKSLLDADRVIAHLPQIAEFNQKLYGFPDSWREKVSVEFPPVVVDAPASPPKLPADRVRNLVFVTKIQPIKRPDLFVRAAATLMLQRPDYTGMAVLSCHVFDAAYEEGIRRLVPESLRHRFVLSRPGPDREALIREGIVVVSSEFESLNLTAYEASVAGAVLLLNGACPAFSERTPFVDGANCLKFNGTVEGLVEAMGRAIDGPELQPVTWTVDRPFWEKPRVTVAPAPAPERQPLVSVVITNHNLGRYLPEALASLAASSYPELEVVLVDDASTDPYDKVLLDQLEEGAQAGRTDTAGVRLIRNPVNRGLPASRNVGVRAARGQYVMPLDADDCISPDFLSVAVQALERHPEYVGVAPTAGYFLSDEELAERRFVNHAVFLGDAPTISLVHNRVSCATALLRREALLEQPYDETLDSYEDWEMYLRLICSGKRFLVTNQVHFFYRRRPGSMISRINPRRHYELVTRMSERLPTPLPASLHLSLLFTPTAEAVQRRDQLQGVVDGLGGAHSVSPARREERPLRYEVIDLLNSTMKQFPIVHPLLKGAMKGAKGSLPGVLLKQAASAPVPTQSAAPVELPLRYKVADQLHSAVKRVPGGVPALKSTVRTALRVMDALRQS
jgi:GT2 family glycosyltransferase/glycosyltransferase involved in cell wall biosynthesis